MLQVSGELHTAKPTASPQFSVRSEIWRTVHAPLHASRFQSRVAVEVHSGMALSLTSMPGARGCTCPAAPMASYSLTKVFCQVSLNCPRSVVGKVQNRSTSQPLVRIEPRLVSRLANPLMLPTDERLMPS